MAKPRAYGMNHTHPKASQRQDRLWQRKLKEQRETVTFCPLARKIAKEKEAQA